MHYFQDLVKDGGVLTAGFAPLALLGQYGTPAVLMSLLNLLIFGLLRIYDIRTRSRERLELARLRIELEADPPIWIRNQRGKA